MDHVGNIEELKHDEGRKDDISESKSLIRGQRMGSNSADNSEISGSLGDRISKTPIHGNQRKSDADLKIGKIKKALGDFANRLRSGSDGKKRYKERNSRKLKKLETR